MNVVVLLSGSSAAFKEAGYGFPKNLADVGGKPLVQTVLEHLGSLQALHARFICLLRREENRTFHTGAVIQLALPSAAIVELASQTSGAACSALLAVQHIDDESPLVIVNGDQFLHDVDLAAAVIEFRKRQLDGGIIVFEDLHPRWSFVKCDEQGLVIETAEKRPISKLATAGFYYFARGSDFVAGATTMIRKDAQVNGLFYICPVYNELILEQKKIGIYQVPKQAYRTLSTPADVNSFNNHSSTDLGA
jgi:dTDP-glucose pyrophosphorylase